LQKTFAQAVFSLQAWITGFALFPALLVRKDLAAGNHDQTKSLPPDSTRRSAAINRMMGLISRCEWLPQKVLGHVIDGRVFEVLGQQKIRIPEGVWELTIWDRGRKLNGGSDVMASMARGRIFKPVIVLLVLNLISAALFIAFVNAPCSTMDLTFTTFTIMRRRVSHLTQSSLQRNAPGQPALPGMVLQCA